MKNPKAWYTVRYSGDLGWYFTYKKPFKANPEWKPVHKFGIASYEDVVKKALIDCGEIVKVRRRIWSFNYYRSQNPAARIIFKPHTIFVPSGEIDKLPALIQAHNDAFFRKWGPDPVSIARKKLAGEDYKVS